MRVIDKVRLSEAPHPDGTVFRAGDKVVVKWKDEQGQHHLSHGPVTVDFFMKGSYGYWAYGSWLNEADKSANQFIVPIEFLRKYEE